MRVRVRVGVGLRVWVRLGVGVGVRVSLEQRAHHGDAALARGGEHEGAPAVVARLQQRVPAPELLEDRAQLGRLSEPRQAEELAHVPGSQGAGRRLRGEGEEARESEAWGSHENSEPSISPAVSRP